MYVHEMHTLKVTTVQAPNGMKVLADRKDLFDSVRFEDLCEHLKMNVNKTTYLKYLRGNFPENYNAKDLYDKSKDLTLFNHPPIKKTNR